MFVHFEAKKNVPSIVNLLCFLRFKNKKKYYLAELFPVMSDQFFQIIRFRPNVGLILIAVLLHFSIWKEVCEQFGSKWIVRRSGIDRAKSDNRTFFQIFWIFLTRMVFNRSRDIFITIQASKGLRSQSGYSRTGQTRRFRGLPGLNWDFQNLSGLRILIFPVNRGAW